MVYGSYVIFKVLERLQGLKKLLVDVPEGDAPADSPATHVMERDEEKLPEAIENSLRKPSSAPNDPAPSWRLQIREELSTSVVVVSADAILHVVGFTACNLPEALALSYKNGRPGILLPELLAELYAEGYFIASQSNENYTLTRAMPAPRRRAPLPPFGSCTT